MDLIELLENDGYDVKFVYKSQHSSPCPWCGGVDRFIIWTNEESGRFWCRQCNAKGDGIDYLMKRPDKKQLSFRDAAQICGKTIDSKKYGYGYSRPPSFERKKPKTLEIKESHYPNQVWQNQAAKVLTPCINFMTEENAYLLIEKKGLSINTILQFNLGINDNTIYQNRALWGLPPDDKDVCIPHGVIIPLIAGGQVVRLRIRTEFRTNKYLVAPGSSDAPMILFSDLSKPLIIVESELDAILAWQEASDLINVAALGSAQMRPSKELHAMIEKAPLLICCLDYDSAGHIAAKKWKRTYPAKFRRPILPRDLKDFGDTVNGGVNLRYWIESLLPAHSLSDGVQASLPLKSPQYGANSPFPQSS